MPATADGGDSAAQTAVGVGVVGYQLQATATVLNGDILAIGHFKIEGKSCGGINATQVPGSRTVLHIKHAC